MRTPYFEVSAWWGGRRVTERRSFADKPNERRALQEFVRRHDSVDIVYVRDSRVRPRQNLIRGVVLHPRFLSQTL